MHMMTKYKKRILATMVGTALATVSFAMVSPQTGACNAWGTVPLQVQVPGAMQAAQFEYKWDDQWFATSSYQYNHDLARISIALASDAYLQPTKGLLDASLKRLGCDANTIRHRYDGYTPQENADKVGYSFGIKTLNLGGQNAKLVFVVVRGTDGVDEWVSNVNISDTIRAKQTYHEGFQKAANLVLKDLDTYLATQKVDPSSVKFVITGHSRGAAVANLIGAALEGATGISKEWGNRSYPAENIYTYTFATPNTCADQSERTSEKYKNIFNVVNPEDIVAKVPLKYGPGWNYGTYGKTFQLPSISNLYRDKSRYKTLLNGMQPYFRQMMNGKDYKPMPGGVFWTEGAASAGYLAMPEVKDFYNKDYFYNHDNLVILLRGLMEDPSGNERYGEAFWSQIVRLEQNSAAAGNWNSSGGQYNGTNSGWLTSGAQYDGEDGGFFPTTEELVDMHASETYHAWILSDSESNIYIQQGTNMIRIGQSENGNETIAMGGFRQAGNPTFCRGVCPSGAINGDMANESPSHLPLLVELRDQNGTVVLRAENGKVTANVGFGAKYTKDGDLIMMTPDDQEVTLSVKASADTNLILDAWGTDADGEASGRDTVEGVVLTKGEALKIGWQGAIRDGMLHMNMQKVDSAANDGAQDNFGFSSESAKDASDNGWTSGDDFKPFG